MNISQFIQDRTRISDRRLFLAIVIFMLIPLLLFGLGSYRTYQLEIEKTKVSSQTLATAVSRYTFDILHGADNTSLSIFALNRQVLLKQNYNSREMSQTLEQIAKLNPYIELIAITDKNGNYRANSAWMKDFDQLSQAKKSLAFREHFIRARDNPEAGLIVSDPVLSNTTGRPVVVLSRRLPSTNQEFNGVLIIAISLKEFSNFFSEVAPGTSNSISLLNNDRVLLARHPLVEDQMGHVIPMNPQLAPFIEARKSSGTYESISEVDSSRKIFSFQTIDGFPMMIIVGTGFSNALESWARTVLYTGISGTLLAFVGALFFFQYVRSLRQSENQRLLIAQSAKMAALGEMAAGIAHEINNPLAIISGRTRQIVRSVSAGQFDAEYLISTADKIEATAFRIAKIISGLKRLARDSASDPLVAVAAMDIVQSTLELSLERFKAHGVRIDVPENSPSRVMCRETEIAQVLLNLLNNAFDAVCSLEEKWIRIEVADTDLTTIIRVTDSGQGIPRDVVANMMVPFFTTKAVGKGTGLGLSISKGIMEEHGGSLRYDPTSENTSFIMELVRATTTPLASQDPKTDSAA